MDKDPDPLYSETWLRYKRTEQVITEKDQCSGSVHIATQVEVCVCLCLCMSIEACERAYQ